MNNFKRNDKVYVLEIYYSRPKFSLVIGVLPGKPLIIKRLIKRSEGDVDIWYSCDRRGRDKADYSLPIPEQFLFKYTRLGELLYG